MSTITKVTKIVDPATNTVSYSTSTLEGVAIRVKGKSTRFREMLKKYEALGLREADAMTLLFVPDTYGDEPPLGGTIEWGNFTYTIADVDTLAPDGVAILSWITITR